MTRPDTPETGSYLSPQGTSFEQRALPPSSLADDYFAYTVKKPIPVEAGDIAPAFDQVGGGTQYKINWGEIANREGIGVKDIPRDKISWLVDMNYLDRTAVIPK